MKKSIISLFVIISICILFSFNVFADYDWSDWTNEELLELLTSLMEEVEIRTSGGSSDSYSFSNNYSTSSSNPSEDAIKEKALTALYNQLSTGKLASSGLFANIKYTDYYDIDATEFNVGTIEKNKNGAWEVKGTIYLYNKYGEYKTSGTFTSIVSKDIRTASCSIKLKDY